MLWGIGPFFFPVVDTELSQSGGVPPNDPILMEVFLNFTNYFRVTPTDGNPHIVVLGELRGQRTQLLTVVCGPPRMVMS